MALRDVMRRFVPRRAGDLLWQLAQRVAYPPDFSAADIALHCAVGPFTMTSPERVRALADAVRYVIANGIPGAFVECGVWRGGSMMVVAKVLLAAGASDRDLFLFDTFEGMPAPTSRDVAYDGRSAAKLLSKRPRHVGDRVWCIADERDVRANLAGTGYPAERIHLIPGRVEETLPGAGPGSIALLRLDTDWYESTLHELRHLEPAVVHGGVVMIDDYGHWSGARMAVDEYLESLRPRPLLHRVDYTARSWIKAPPGP